MTYALVTNGAVSAFPFSDRQLRNANPNVSFPADMTDADRAAFGVLPVVEQLPAHNPKTHRAAPLPMEEWPVGADSITATYEVVPLTEAERAPFTNAAILSAPDQGFGGPTVKELFNGNR